MGDIHDSALRLKLPKTVYPPREDTWLLIESLMGPVNKYDRVLEIGAGSGAVSISLAKMGWDVTAIDVNPLAVAATRANALENGGHVIDCIEGSFDEIQSLREGMFDLIVWNIPYLEIPSGSPSLEIIEESSMIDTGSGGWSTELRGYLNENPSMLSPDGCVVLLYRTYPESPSKPEEWLMDGWSTRTISSLFIGGEKLEVVGHWRPGLNGDPFHVGEAGSTMDYEFPGESRFERIFADIQTSGRGRSGTDWITDPEGIAATWRINGMNGLSPGVLQVGVGSALASSFNMHLKWPNDIVDREYKKCGGVLCTLQSEGDVKIGVGMNKHEQRVEHIETTGWDYSLPGVDKFEGMRIADAAVSSAIDNHPLIGIHDSETILTNAWKKISRVLSRGCCANFDDMVMRPVGLNRIGEIMLINNKSSELRCVSQVGGIIWRLAS